MNSERIEQPEKLGEKPGIVRAATVRERSSSKSHR